MSMDEEKMSCGAWGSEELLDHVQGRLPAETAGRIRAHAAECAACRAALEDLSVLASLARAPAGEPGPAADGAIRRAIRAEAERRSESRPAKSSSSRIRILRLRRRAERPVAPFLLGAAAMALFAVLLGYALLQDRSPRGVPVAARPGAGPRTSEPAEPAPEPPAAPRTTSPRPEAEPPRPAAPLRPEPAPPPPPAASPPAPPRIEPSRPVETVPVPLPEFGRVARLTGKAERGSVPLREQDVLASGDALACRSGLVLVELPDRSLVLLRAGAAAALDRREGRTVVRLSEGELACSVAPDPARVFVVESPHGAVTVKGTIFSVRASSAGASVSVARGHVEARTEAGAVDLGAGERTSMSRSTRPGRPEPVSVDRAFGWTLEGGFELPPAPFYLGVTFPQAELRAPMSRSRLFAAGSLSGEPAFAAVDARTLPGFGGRFLAPNRDEGGSITFTFDLRREGEWYLWGRLFFPASGTQLWRDDREPRENDPNSFYASVDGGPERVFGNLKVDPETGASWYRRWHWGGDGAVELGKARPLALGKLAAGRHTVRIRNRDSVETSSLRLAPRLDAICVSPDRDYRPRDEDFRK
jgi:hypothetical protein